MESSPSRPRPWQRARRGGSAIEFALTLPLLVVCVTSTVDYGWYFLQETFVTNALSDAVRAGSYGEPAVDEAPGECRACLTQVSAVAVAELETLGIAVVAEDVMPVIVNIQGTCAIVLQPGVPHTALVGFVPTPSTYDIRLVAYAQNVTGC